MQQKIEKDQMFEMLLKACPNISGAWTKHLEDWRGEERGDYNDITVMALYIVDECENGNIRFFPSFFDTVEFLLKNGTEETKQLLVIGLIEDIQTHSSHYFGYKVFEKYLGSETLNAWNHVIKLWEGKTSLMEVFKAEQNQE